MDALPPLAFLAPAALLPGAVAAALRPGPRPKGIPALAETSSLLALLLAVAGAAQLALAAWSGFALVTLFWAIRQGLLGAPAMQIAGNDSTAYALRWFQDRSDGATPAAGVLSVPLWVYRVAMLAWALWLARALLGWLRWGFESWSAGGTWRPLRAAPRASAGRP